MTTPPPTVKAIVATQAALLAEAREERKAALVRLMEKIAEIPVEEGFVGIGEVIANRKKDDPP